MFATTLGSVRRNRLADCVPHTQNGKRVMAFEGEEKIVDVQVCTAQDDVLLTSKRGQCIRFPVEDVRVFGGGGQTGTSTGVRGMKTGKEDEIISLAILHHIDASAEERAAYLKMARAVSGEEEENGDEEAVAETTITQERYAEMGAAEQFILTVSSNGYGKRTSSYEYRITGRGGKGIVAMTVNSRNGPLVASFPVENEDQIMLVTDGGQLIRCPVHDIRKAGRSTQGVTILDTAEGEHVVSVERLSEEAEGEG
jgi:DNA gyrase subunit A